MTVEEKVPVDFGNCDVDGSVRLITRGTLEYLKMHDISLSEGLHLSVTDGEVNAEGVCTLHEGMWVLKIERWL